jgi:hypothetical protein
MNSSSTVSIITPTNNSALFVEEALKSAVTETCDLLEVIVAYIPAGQRLGCRALEQVFSHIRGERLAFPDADDVWPPRKLEWQIQAFESNANLI